MSRFVGSCLALLFLVLGFWAIPTAAKENRGKGKPDESTPVTPAEIEAREDLKRALTAESRGDNEARSTDLTKAVSAMPELQEAHWHLGKVEMNGKWLPLATAEMEAANDPQQIEYRAQRDKASNVKLLQNLARWCVKNDWEDEAQLHYTQLLASPEATKAMRSEATKRLNLHQINGSWTTNEEVKSRQQELIAVQDAFATWHSPLVKLQPIINGSDYKARDKAIAEFHQVDDPAVIPALESFVLTGGDRFSEEIVNLLAGFPTEKSTVALTRFAVFSEFFAVRNAAIAELRKRSLHDFVPLLLSGLVAPIRSQHYITTDASGTVSYMHVLTRETPAANQVAISGQVARAIEQPSQLPVVGGVRQAIREARYNEQLNSASTVARSIELDAYFANLQQKPLNDRVFAALEETTQEQVPREASSWWKWWQEYNEVYWPKPTQYAWGLKEHVYVMPRLASCFLAGTPVRTQNSFAAIETVQPGDRVLAQDQDTGELSYKLVLRTTLRPPADMLKITAGSEEIVTTLGHPFWVSGHGWTMAKQLKVGDLLHSVDGAIRIEAIEAGGKHPAHNLVVADFNSYFVGNQCLLVHDNEYRKPTRCIVPGLIAD